MDLKAMKPTGMHRLHTVAIQPPYLKSQIYGSWFPSGKYFCQSISCAVGLIATHDSCKSFSILFCPCAKRCPQLNSKLLRPMSLWGLHGRSLSLLRYLNLLDSAWLAPRHLTDHLHLNLDHPTHALLQMKLNSKPQGWLTRWTSKCQHLQIHCLHDPTIVKIPETTWIF